MKKKIGALCKAFSAYSLLLQNDTSSVLQFACFFLRAEGSVRAEGSMRAEGRKRHLLGTPICLLYSYKGTNIDAEERALAAAALLLFNLLALLVQFTSFTSTKVHILTALCKAL